MNDNCSSNKNIPLPAEHVTFQNSLINSMPPINNHELFSTGSFAQNPSNMRTSFEQSAFHNIKNIQKDNIPSVNNGQPNIYTSQSNNKLFR
jgi:hypothetical protein